MSYRPEHRAETRRRILASAGRLFRQRGFANAGIDEIMSGAGLTRGGFYLHFGSKEDLFAAVVGEEPEFARQLRLARERKPGEPGEAAREAIRYYLAPENRGRIARGCTIVSNAADIARSGRKSKAAFTRAFDSLLEEFRDLAIAEGSDDPRASALASIATCVGGVVLGRALRDPALVEELLEACREAALRELGGEPDGGPRRRS